MTKSGSTTSQKQRKAAERRRRQAVRRDRERRAAEAAAQTEEERQEKIAPAAQRQPVLAPDGTVLRAARVEPDGKAFRVSNPIRALVRRGETRSASGGGQHPMIHAGHATAAERLSLAWEEGGRGVGKGASNYGERSSGTLTSGSISDATLAALAYQNRKRSEFLLAKRWLGSLWGIIEAVALAGMDVTAWAKRERKDARAAVGFLAAALDRLVEFYERMDAPPPKRQPGRIQAATVVPRVIGEAS